MNSRPGSAVPVSPDDGGVNTMEGGRKQCETSSEDLEGGTRSASQNPTRSENDSDEDDSDDDSSGSEEEPEPAWDYVSVKEGDSDEDESQRDHAPTACGNN
tara:strand:- start:3961 stop:4263 length:303 start_codon:yes stop_codon:yes gene_type:complete